MAETHEYRQQDGKTQPEIRASIHGRLERSPCYARSSGSNLTTEAITALGLRQTDRHTNKHTERHNYRQKDIQKDRHTEVQKGIQNLQSESQIYKETGRERIGSQTVMQTERQAYRKTDKQRERNRQIYRQSKR